MDYLRGASGPPISGTLNYMHLVQGGKQTDVKYKIPPLSGETIRCTSGRDLHYGSMSDFITPTTTCSLVTLSGRAAALARAGMQPNFENDTSSGFPRNPDEAARSRVPPAVRISQPTQIAINYVLGRQI